MNQLLDDVLLIGKAEAGKLECNPTALDIVQFCHDLVEEMQMITDSHTIQFNYQSESSDVALDEKLLRHILINLLSNAIKYSPASSTVSFELITEAEKIIFRIQDRGIGIPKPDREQLFQSFYRASNVGTISGTGLGLAIVKRAVDLHSGEIAIESEVGIGTTFVVALPGKCCFLTNN
jgi:signal transduction histidine kinase